MTSPQMPLTPEEQFLSGGGVVSMSFRGTPPISIEGFVIGEPVLQQQRDFETSKPVFWGDGGGTTDDAFDIQGQPRRPVMQLAVKLQTAWRNGEGAPRPETVQNDDGIRGVYLAFERQKAVSEALSRVPGMRGLHGGDWLRLTFYAEDHARQVGKKNPPKLFSAEVRQSDRQPQDDMWASAPETYAKAPQVAPPAYSQPGSGYGAPAPDPYSLPPAPASNGWGAPAGYAENPALQQQQQQPLRPLPAPAAAAPPAPAPAPAPAPIHLEAPQVQTISDEILRTLGPGAILGLKAAGQIPANWGDE